MKRWERRAEQWKRFRRRFKFNQTELGAVLGISRMTVSHIERGTHEPLKSTLRKFKALEARYAGDRTGLGFKWRRS